MVVILDNERDFTEILTILLRDVEKVDMSQIRIVRNAIEFNDLIKEVEPSTITAAFLDHDLSPQFDTKQIPFYTGKHALERLKELGYTGQTYTISAYSEKQSEFVRMLFDDPSVIVISKSLSDPDKIIREIKNELEKGNNEIKTEIK